MKKIALVFVALFSLSGCGRSSKVADPYQFDKDTYLYECNPDTVMFKSNYRVEMYVDDVLRMTSDLDYGKACTNNEYYYYLVEQGDSAEVTSYRQDGSFNTTIQSKEYLYNYWFGFGKYLFELKYEDFSYNQEKKYYECDRVELSEFVIEKGIFKAYNKKPIYIEYNIVGQGKFAMQFSKHGEVTVNLPAKPSYSATVTLDYQIASGQTLQDAIAYRLGGLNIDYRVEDLGNNKCTVTYVYSNFRLSSIIEALLTTSGNVKISNAHDVFVNFSKNSYIDNDTLVVPFDLSNSVNRSLLEQTISDLENNRTDYAESYQIDIEEEETKTLYMYNLYLWGDYDGTVHFEDIKVGSITNLLAKINIASLDINDYKNGFKLSFYFDLNHDGLITSDEQELIRNYLPLVQRYLNFTSDGSTFVYSSN